MFRTNLSRRARALVIVALLGLVVAACGGGDKKETKRVKPAKVTTTTSTTAPPPAAPLTGIPQSDAAKLGRPAMIVKVDNGPQSIGIQEGLDDSDVVFVEQIEQGATRLAAVVQSEDTTIGPVRSARTTDTSLAGAFNKPLFVYSGANGGVLRSVRTSPALVDSGIDARGVTPVYTRNERGRTSLYRYFIPTADIYAARQGGAAPAPILGFRPAGQASTGDLAKGVRISYGGGTATLSLYEWNGKGWARTQNGVPHTLKNGTRVEPQNVIVMTTGYRSSGYRDTTGALSPEAVLEGGGEALILSDGKVVRGKWNRPGPNATFSFTDSAGTPVAVTAGQTWIELAPGPNATALL